ncbi:MAG: family HAD-type hydrolase [Rhodospirillales bacterium]|jgi:HAD superfamily hydrolase (TIGR01459 family)|nr:family HAD-type hydrolase [Rhodospirillales bacterium]
MSTIPPAAVPSPPVPSGMRDLAPRYDGFIVDLWGVVHDGLKPLPGVVDCLERLIAAGKRILILSNAPRRAADVIDRITEIGIAPGLYHHVMTSGEDTWQHLSQRPDAFYAGLGPAVLHLGPPRDNGLREGLGLVVVEHAAEADFILNTGTWGWEAETAPYDPVLREGAARGLPMICANPDLVVRNGDQLAICAGMLAQRYEEMGGIVRWHGKPLSGIYETCLALLGIADKSRILAIGDSLRTDIAGAVGAGLDCVLVAGGIHAEEFGVAPGQMPDAAKLTAAFAAAKVTPTYVLPSFAW